MRREGGAGGCRPRASVRPARSALPDLLHASTSGSAGGPRESGSARSDHSGNQGREDADGSAHAEPRRPRAGADRRGRRMPVGARRSPTRQGLSPRHAGRRPGRLQHDAARQGERPGRRASEHDAREPGRRRDVRLAAAERRHDRHGARQPLRRARDLGHGGVAGGRRLSPRPAGRSRAWARHLRSAGRRAHRGPTRPTSTASRTSRPRPAPWAAPVRRRARSDPVFGISLPCALCLLSRSRHKTN